MKHLTRLGLLLILLAAFALRLHELTKQNIWWDEARNIDVALRPFWQIATAPELDIHPPIYFWLLHLWSRFLGLGDSTQISVAALAPPAQLTFIVRSLSGYASVISVALLVHMVRLWPGRSQGAAAVVVAFIAAASPFWLAESQEARMYTVSFMLLLVAAIGLVRGVIRRDAISHEEMAEPTSAPRRPLLVFVLFSALSLLTHYNALFIVVAWYGWWGLWALLQPDRWRWMRQIVGYGLLMSLLVLPIAPIALRQIPGYSNPNLTVPSIRQYLVDNWQTYFGGYAFSPDLLSFRQQSLGIGWLWAIGAIVVIGLLFQLWTIAGKNASPQKRGYLSFLLVWLIGGLGLYYIAVIDRGAFNPRYSSFVTPALYALVAVVLVSGTKRGQAAITGSSTGSSTGSFIGTLAGAILGIGLIGVGYAPAVYADLYDDRFAREDMEETVAWLNENAGPKDIIFVDQKYPFGFYYDRFVIDAESEYPAVADAANPKPPSRYLFVDINTIDQRLDEWASQAERIFWLQWFESDTDPRGSVRFLLDQQGAWSGERHFRGYSVDWWTMEPPTQFELAPAMEAATYIFPPAVETLELSLPTEPVQPGSAVPIVIRWKRVSEGWTDRPLKARIALYRPGENSRLGQDDRPILNDRHLLPSEWGQADQPLNVYAVPLPADLPPGRYEARLLIYDAESLEPLTYVDIAGNPAGIEAVIGEITVQ